MDLISVIVPIYKVEAYLDRCVQSIVDQTYKNLEIILVDDGSPDRCPEMCDIWAKKDTRIRVIHKRNGGQSDARNVGIDTAKGSYIAFVDSDDWIDSCFIEYLYNGIQQTGADVCACAFRITYPDSPDTASTPPPFCVKSYSAEEALATLIKGHTFCAVVWNKLYSAKLLNGIRFELGKYIDDEFFSYRVLGKARHTAFVPVELHNYLQRSGSLMSAFSIRRLEALDAYLERIAYFKEHFPKLYVEDSATFSICCANFYICTLDQPTAEQRAMQLRIKECRKSMHYPLSLLRKHSIRNIIYILGTGLCIHPFCRILKYFRKES